MCGIAGIIKFNDQKVDENSIRNMMSGIKHRGPDDEGVFLEDNIGFGFVRLSIIDLSEAGHQPKFSNDERYVIIFNGEIYNYIELREELESEGVVFKTKTDTEVLLNAYIKWGEDCLNIFNGMWAFAIYDRVEKTIFAARDRFGIKPFYYIYNNDQFSFCSEIPPLLSLLENKPKANYQSIFDFLVFNRTDQTENTFFEEVNKLQHGCKLNICNNKVEIKKWYNLRKEVANSVGFVSPKEFKNLFNSAIGLRLRSDVPVGVCLSGGLDSSSIVSIIVDEFKQKELQTFSAVYKKGQEGDESEFINEYKSNLKNMHFVRPDAISLEKDLTELISTHAEPMPSTSIYAQYKVMELAKGNVVVTLDGQGADEALGGYHYFFGFNFKDLVKHGNIGKLSSELFYYLTKHQSLFGIKTFFYFLLPSKIRTKANINKLDYLKPLFEQKFIGSNSIAGNIYGSDSLKDALLDHFEFKLEHLLKWEDRNSMHFSIEARVPFLDYRLVERALATSNDWLIRKGMTKHILREAMKGLLPEKIRMRKDKMGYGTPEDEWFREPSWQKIITEIVTSDSLKKRNLIDSEKAMNKYNLHLKGKKNLSPEIWKWIHLELWFRKYID